MTVAWRTFAIALLAMMALTACGKRGNLERPEGSTYPRSYPPE